MERDAEVGPTGKARPRFEQADTAHDAGDELSASDVALAETSASDPGATVTAYRGKSGADDNRPAAEVSAALAIDKGAQIGRFQVLHKLGEGGMGVVVAAYDPLLDRKVAIKVLRPRSLERAAAERSRTRLLREAQAMAKLSHPNVLPVFDAGTIGEQVYIAMEYVDGETLTEWLRAEQRTSSEILTMYTTAGMGLAAAHRAGLVHRDFKPDNVLIGKDGRVRVCDFGLVGSAASAIYPDDDAATMKPPAGALAASESALGASLTRTGDIMGTPLYMAPEQHRGEQTDALSDQFSFCVALFEALLGKAPFPGATYEALAAAVAKGEVAWPESQPREVPATIRAVLSRGLKVDSEQRYRDMDALLSDLTPDSARPNRWRRVAAIALILLGAGLFVGSTLVVRSERALARRKAEQGLREARILLLEAIKDRSRDVERLAASPQLVNAVLNAPAQAQPIVEREASDLPTARIEVIGDDGRAIADARGSDPARLEAVAVGDVGPSIESTFRWRSIATLVPVEARLVAMRVAAPILDLSFKVPAVAVMTIPLDSAYLSSLKDKLPDTDILVFTPLGRGQSTLPSSAAITTSARDLDQVVNQRRSLVVDRTLQGRDYAVAYAPLVDASDEVVGAFAAAVRPRGALGKARIGSYAGLGLGATGLVFLIVLLVPLRRLRHGAALGSVVATLACGASVVGCDAAPSLIGSANDPATIIVGRNVDAVSLDPARVSDKESVEVIGQIYEQLLAYDPHSATVVPALATSWQTSRDGRVWTFALRRGVEFHDGTEFNADAVVFSFERQRDPEHEFHTGRFFYWNNVYRNVESVAKIDDFTVQITIERRYAPFEANLALFPVAIVSPTAVRSFGEDYAEHPVGTGPFRFVSWDKDSRIVLQRNDSYWGEQPDIERLVFEVIADPRQRLIALQSGSIDVALALLPRDARFISLHPDLTGVSATANNVAYLAMNNLHPPFDDVRVRRAVNHAVNKQAIIELAYQGNATIANGALPPFMPSYHQVESPYDYDPTRARALLEEAAAEQRFDSNRALRLLVPSEPRPYLAAPELIARIIQAQLEEVGITVEVVVQEFEAHLNSVQAGKHDLCLLGWVGDNGDPDNYLYTLLDRDNTVPGVARNVAFYRDPETHGLLLMAQEADDREARNGYYAQVQERIHEHAPWVPLVHTTTTFAVRRDLEGIVVHALSRDLDYSAARRVPLR